MATRRQRSVVKIRARGEPQNAGKNTGITPPTEEPPDNNRAVKNSDEIKQILSRPVLTPKEVAALLRVTPSTIMQFVEDGDLPSMRMNRSVRILRIDVLRFMHDLRDEQARLRRYDESHAEEQEWEEVEEEDEG